MTKVEPPLAPFELGDVVREKKSKKLGHVIGLRMPHKPGVQWRVRVDGFDGELNEFCFELVVKPEDWEGSLSPETYWKKYKTTGKDHRKLRLAKALMEQNLIPEDFEFGKTRIGQGVSQLKGEVKPISKKEEEEDGNDAGEGNEDAPKDGNPNDGAGEDRAGSDSGQSEAEASPNGNVGEIRGESQEGIEGQAGGKPESEKVEGKEEVEGKKEVGS